MGEAPPDPEPDVQEQKAARRAWLKEILFAGGLLAAAFGFGGKVAEDVWNGSETEMCEMAHQTVMDDRLNVELAGEQRRAYLEKQFQIAMSCADRELD